MLKRHIEDELAAYLRLMPVVLLTGARQTGKTTLVESLSQKAHYITFDDEIALSAARNEGESWLASLPKPLVIDEVQRFPEIFRAIKRDVDQKRKPGRYLLTGSANPLLLPRLGDSLAGRMGVVSLYPFSQGELEGKKERFLKRIFLKEEIESQSSIEKAACIELMLKGGFPATYGWESIADIARWMQAYLDVMLKRDVRDLAKIEGIHEFPRLLRLLATRTASLMNAAEVSRTMGMVNMTVSRYLHLLEALFFLYPLPAWSSNRGKRLRKKPKLFLCDTAMLAHLLEIEEEGLEADPHLFGQFVENFVFTELVKQMSWSGVRCELFHFRDGDREVDFAIERPDGKVVGIEVKTALKVRSNDLGGLHHFQKIAGEKFHRGIVLYLGKQSKQVGEKMFALPLSALWE